MPENGTSSLEATLQTLEDIVEAALRPCLAVCELCWVLLCRQPGWTLSVAGSDKGTWKIVPAASPLRF